MLFVWGDGFSLNIWEVPVCHYTAISPTRSKKVIANSILLVVAYLYKPVDGNQI